MATGYVPSLPRNSRYQRNFSANAIPRQPARAWHHEIHRSRSQAGGLPAPRRIRHPGRAQVNTFAVAQVNSSVSRLGLATSFRGSPRADTRSGNCGATNSFPALWYARSRLPGQLWCVVPPFTRSLWRSAPPLIAPQLSAWHSPDPARGDAGHQPHCIYGTLSVADGREKGYGARPAPEGFRAGPAPPLPIPRVNVYSREAPAATQPFLYLVPHFRSNFFWPMIMALITGQQPSWGRIAVFGHRRGCRGA